VSHQNSCKGTADRSLRKRTTIITKMSMHRPVELAQHPAPPFRPNSPYNYHKYIFGSQKLGHMTKADVARQQILFGTARVKPVAIEEQVKQLKEHEQTHTAMLSHSQDKSPQLSPDDMSPSVQAEVYRILCENKFGDQVGPSVDEATPHYQ
jgi:hypothetical protein